MAGAGYSCLLLVRVIIFGRLAAIVNDAKCFIFLLLFQKWLRGGLISRVIDRFRIHYEAGQFGPFCILRALRFLLLLE